MNDVVLKDLIQKSARYDDEFVKVMLNRVISDRLAENELLEKEKEQQRDL